MTGHVDDTSGLTVVRRGKNMALRRYEGEGAIDAAADSVRSRFATPNMHQIYSDKRNEAERYLTAAADEPPDLSDYPYLSAEVGITSETPQALAALWLYMDAQWKQVAAFIEQIRIASKAQVRAANSAAEIDQIVSSTRTLLDGIGDKPPQRPPSKPISPA